MTTTPTKLGAARLAICIAGVLLQLAGVVAALRTGWDEVNLFIGLMIFCLGSLLVIFTIERHVAPAPDKHGERTTPSATNRLIGLVVTVLISAGLVWAVFAWITWSDKPATVGAVEMKSNEQRAFRRLGSLIEAQERYKEKDWDGDGKRSYAAFYIHLWQSVDREGNPVPVGLISRELGFAMVRRFPLDGYVYESLHSRKPIPAGSRLSARSGSSSGDDLDPTKEWAITAMPAAQNWTGMIPFIAESSGKIWTPVRKAAGDAASVRWVAVRSLEHLKEIQRSVTYPTRSR